MLLRSIALKTFRDQRLAVLAWGGGLGLAALANAVGWAKAYPDAASRRLLAQELSTGALNQVRLIYGAPHNIDRLGGWVEWRGLSFVTLLLGLFMVIAATGESRGQEARGDLEMALSAPHRRSRVFSEQAAGLLLALMGTGLLIAVGLLLCAPAAKAGVIPAGHVLGAVLNTGVAAAIWGAVALLVGQFTRARRTAATAAATLMFVAYFVNTAGLTNSDVSQIRRLSPFAMYTASTPLSTGRVDAGALIGQALLAVLLAVLAGWLFTTRDIGGSVKLPLIRRLRPRRRRRSRRLLGNIFSRALRDSLGAALAWGIGLGAYAVLFVAVTPGAVEAFRGQPNVQEALNRLGRSTALGDAQLLSFALFGILPAMAAICAITLVSSWTAEESDGRLAMELACPISRPRYYAERLAAALVAASIVVIIAGAAYAVAVPIAGVDADAGRSALAVAMIVPVVAVVIAFGFAVAAAGRFSASGVTSLAVAGSFLFALVAPLFGWPGGISLLSIFHLYGHPLTDGLDAGRLATLLTLTALFTITGLLAFQRKSIAH